MVVVYSEEGGVVVVYPLLLLLLLLLLEQADIASREGGALLSTPHARGGVRPPPAPSPHARGGVVAEDPPGDSWSEPSGPLILHSFRSIFRGHPSGGAT